MTEGRDILEAGRTELDFGNWEPLELTEEAAGEPETPEEEREDTAASERQVVFTTTVGQVPKISKTRRAVRKVWYYLAPVAAVVLWIVLTAAINGVPVTELIGNIADSIEGFFAQLFG